LQNGTVGLKPLRNPGEQQNLPLDQVVAEMARYLDER